MTAEVKPQHVRVYLEDTDAGGIVYHASYLRFMERARTEYLRQIGLEQSRTFELDVSFVVHTMSLEFQRPATLDAELEVTCELVEAKGARLFFEQVVRETHTQLIACTATVSVACISLTTKRPRRIPPELLTALQRS